MPPLSDAAVALHDGFGEGVPPEEHEEWERSLRGMSVAESMPAFRWVTVDAEDNLWVEEWDDVGLGQGLFSVFRTDGVWLGSVEVPDGLPSTRGGLFQPWVEIGGALGLSRGEVGPHPATLMSLEATGSYIHPVGSQLMGPQIVETPHTQSARDLPSVRHAHRDRATWWTAILVSVAIHMLAFLFWRGDGLDRAGGLPPSHMSPPIPAAELIEVVQITRAAPGDIPVPRPVLSIELPSIKPHEFAASVGGSALMPMAPVSPLAAVPIRASDTDTDTNTDTDGDAGERYLPPIPRSILPNWRLPRSVQGMEVVVRVYVDAGGRAGRAVELYPPTPDRGFNRRLVDRVRKLEYRPALRNDRPVAGWAEITFVFCPRQVTATSPRAPEGRRSPNCSATGSGGPQP